VFPVIPYSLCCYLAMSERETGEALIGKNGKSGKKVKKGKRGKRGKGGKGEKGEKREQLLKNERVFPLIYSRTSLIASLYD